MHRLNICTFLIFLLTVVVAQSQSSSASIDAYIASQSPIAKANLLANIGPTGSKSQGAKPGVVIASPSSKDPDYLYTWTRDSSLVFKLLIDQYTLGLDNSPSLRKHIDNFIAAEGILQQVSNPSGSVASGGLGEPKFNIDQTAFTGAWGRPQRDGPALRANAMITYANYLIAHKNISHVITTLWPIIKLDLDYVADNWNKTTFDLWEEVSSSSFFTTAVQHRSLRQGAALATAIGQPSVVSGYTAQATNLLCFLQSYWNPSLNSMTANTNNGRSGKDANTVLTSIHTFDSSAGCDPNTFQPCSDRALSNLLVYVNAFRSIYSINIGIPENQGIATGRYPEDGYMGGNPWYLTTLAVAEQLYDALTVWKLQSSLSVTPTSLAFFQNLVPTVKVGTYTAKSATYATLIAAVKSYADGFVATVAKYTPSGGGLAEQYSKVNGVSVSAVDLTWSYAAALTAFGARAGVVPSSWGAKGLVIPSTCSTASGTGTGGGSGGGGGGGGGGSATVEVTFNVQATTVFGENIYLTGSVDELHHWSPDNAILLSADNYPKWSTTVKLPADTSVEYKYIRKFNGVITWEADPNMRIKTPISGSFIENDNWR